MRRYGGMRLLQVLGALVALTLSGTTAASAVPRSSGPPVACPPTWLGTTTNAEPRISADGRFVVWTGYGPDGEIGDRTIFLRDLRRGRTTVVSDPARVSYNFLPDISDDGNRVSYLRRDPEDFDNDAELWVYDRRTGARTNEGVSFTQRVPALDGTGRYVTYEQLHDGNTNLIDIFVRDVDRNVTTLVSTNVAGRPANGTSTEPSISRNGRYVLFRSYATDLTADSGPVGNNGALFVRDLRKRRTTLLRDRHGEVSSAYRFDQSLSPDGRFVAYADPDGAWRYDRRTGRTVAVGEPRTEDYFIAPAAIGTRGRKVLLTIPGALVVHDLRTGRETAVDVRPDGTPDPLDGASPGGMTPDGRYVVFYTTTPDLDPRDTGQGYLSIYVRDLRRSTTRLVSSTHAGGKCESPAG